MGTRMAGLKQPSLLQSASHVENSHLPVKATPIFFNDMIDLPQDKIKKLTNQILQNNFTEVIFLLALLFEFRENYIRGIDR